MMFCGFSAFCKSKCVWLFAGVQKGNAMRAILNDLLSDAFQSSLPEKGGVPLPQNLVRLPQPPSADELLSIPGLLGTTYEAASQPNTSFTIQSSQYDLVSAVS